MSELRTMVLLDAASVTATTKVKFALTQQQVPATISCKGVAASGEDINIQKLVSGDKINDAADADFQTIADGGTDKVLNADNNSLVINGPGVYRIQTANVTYASLVNVVVDH